MSLSRNPKLTQIAKSLCRELRKKSTPAEKIFWEAVRNRKFLNLKFYRQYPLYFDCLGKETFFITDFYCHERKLVVEIDGGYHERQKEHDKLRTHIINIMGIEVMRFENEVIKSQLQIALLEIKQHINKTIAE